MAVWSIPGWWILIAIEDIEFSSNGLMNFWPFSKSMYKTLINFMCHWGYHAGSTSAFFLYHSFISALNLLAPHFFVKNYSNISNSYIEHIPYAWVMKVKRQKTAQNFLRRCHISVLCQWYFIAYIISTPFSIHTRYVHFISHWFFLKKNL